MTNGDNTRSLSVDEAKGLPPGSAHYTAYVGPPGQYDFMGATQFRLLCTLGLREHHSVLDFGCGSLRAGRLLIPYLREGKYCGIDPNHWLIEDAIAHETGRDLINIKRPVFRHDDDFDATHFQRKFAFILVQSVFSHAGRDIIAKALASFKKCLEPDGLILATFIHPDQPGVGKEFAGSGWVYPAVVSYRPQTVLNLIDAAAMVGRTIPWFHPRQTWYAMAHSPRALPPLSKYPHLSGAVLRDPELNAST
jgi:SAM-dependent methyltransferase